MVLLSTMAYPKVQGRGYLGGGTGVLEPTLGPGATFFFENGNFSFFLFLTILATFQKLFAFIQVLQLFLKLFKKLRQGQDLGQP